MNKKQDSYHTTNGALISSLIKTFPTVLTNTALQTQCIQALHRADITLLLWLQETMIS